jgi:hypothetical protein
MQPKFVKEYIHELRQNFTVIDRQNRRINVKFNGSLQHPLIFQGWTEMRDFLGINTNKLLLMTYVGNNSFVVDILQQELQFDSLPSYHSYKHFFTNQKSFDVTLTQDKATSSQLVSLHFTFVHIHFNTSHYSYTIFNTHNNQITTKHQ